MHSTLIIRLPNWIGDAVMCLPTIMQLQNLNIPLVLFGRPWIHDLFKPLGIPMVSCPKSKIQAIQILKHIPANQILLMTNSFSTALVAKLAGKQSIGYAGDARQFLLTHAIQKPLNFHETEVFNYLTQEMLKHWYPKLYPTNFPPYPQIQLKNDDELLKKYQLKQPFIVLCPFAHGKSPEGISKKWPHWQALSQELKEFRPVICPGPNELEEAQNLYPDIYHLPHLKLDEYWTILSKAQIIIANDSGPLHMASATGQPTIAIFGSTSEKRTAPKNAITLGKMGQWPSLEEVLKAFYTHSLKKEF